MGKSKEQNIEAINAFSRMNYLYQASVVASKTIPDSVLGNYYGRLMKEVSKKVVEKIHPHIKRRLCSSCSYPSFAGSDYGRCKIKPFMRRKKGKKRKKKDVHKGCGYIKKTEIDEIERMEGVEIEGVERGEGIDTESKYSTRQKEKKNFKPNRLLWSCKNCGYLRIFLQRPTHQLWIEKFQDNPEDNLENS